MKKLVNHYGPTREEEADPILDSANDLAEDPGLAAEREKVEYQNGESASKLRDWVSPKVAEKLETADQIVRGVLKGAAILRTLKAVKDRVKAVKLSRTAKITAGALVVAGVAGAIYMRNRRKKFL